MATQPYVPAPGPPPEPVASWVDYVSALQAQEAAIHASTPAAAATAMQQAVAQLQHAQAYWTVAGNGSLAGRTGAVAGQLAAMATYVGGLPPAELGSYQQRVLYPYQGQLGALLYAAQGRQPWQPRDWVVLGLTLAGLGLSVAGIVWAARVRRAAGG